MADWYHRNGGANMPIFAFTLQGLIVVPEKNSLKSPNYYLGRVIHSNHISPQNLQIRTDKLLTNDFQKLLGDFSWIRPSDQEELEEAATKYHN